MGATLTNSHCFIVTCLTGSHQPPSPISPVGLGDDTGETSDGNCYHSDPIFDKNRNTNNIYYLMIQTVSIE